MRVVYVAQEPLAYWTVLCATAYNAAVLRMADAVVFVFFGSHVLPLSSRQAFKED